MKRSPQVSAKSCSVSSELQSINTAGRAFSQEGSGAVGCSPCNSKGTQIKQCNLYYYSLQEGSSVSADKPLLSRSLSGAATDRLYNTKIPADFPKKTWGFVHVPPAVFPEQRQMWPFLWLQKYSSFSFPLEKGLLYSLKPGTMTVLHSIILHLPITDYLPEQQTLIKLSHSSVFHMNSSEFHFLLKDQASKKLLTLADFLFPSFHRSLSSCCLLLTGFLQRSVYNLN